MILGFERVSWNYTYVQRVHPHLQYFHIYTLSRERERDKCLSRDFQEFPIVWQQRDWPACPSYPTEGKVLGKQIMSKQVLFTGFRSLVRVNMGWLACTYRTLQIHMFVLVTNMHRQIQTLQIDISSNTRTQTLQEPYVHTNLNEWFAQIHNR